MRVFARKGFHASRVGDIAEEAGVAHGLLYHYFKSKDDVLEAVFHENWNLLQLRIASVEETDEPAADQLRHVAAIVLRTWLHLPDVVTVVIREFGRSPELADRIGELAQPIEVIQRIIARGIERGEFRPEHRPQFAATVVYGSHRRAAHRLGARAPARRRGGRRRRGEDAPRGQPARAFAAVATSSAKRAAPTLPPERTTPTDASLASSFPLSSAATPTAPLGSVTSFIRSKRKTIASTISSSLTVTTSSTRFLFTSKVSSPGSVACRPSAIVRGTSIRTRSPAASERRVSSPASGSTPTTRIPGRKAFAAVAQPRSARLR